MAPRQSPSHAGPSARRAISGLLFASVAVCGGCGGGGGDPLSAPPADLYGSASRLTDLLGAATWLEPANPTGDNCKAIPVDRAVTVSGATVTGVDRFDETGEGSVGNVYVQDSLSPPVEYSGITVFDPGFSPPDLRVVQGDVVDVRGTLTEFAGPSAGPFAFCQSLPEISGTMSLRFDGDDGTAATIGMDQLSNYASARAWFGVLVRLQNVTVAADPKSSSGRYSAALQVPGGATEQPAINNELFDLENDGPPVAQGTFFKSVTGIITYFYGVHIAPRSAADIVP